MSEKLEELILVIQSAVAAWRSGDLDVWMVLKVLAAVLQYIGTFGSGAIMTTQGGGEVSTDLQMRFAVATSDFCDALGFGAERRMAVSLAIPDFIIGNAIRMLLIAVQEWLEENGIDNILDWISDLISTRGN